MLDVIDIVDFSYYTTDQRTKRKSEHFGVSEITERKMMIETRPRYPSDKLTITIANITKNKPIRYFSIYLLMDEQFDVDVVLEDSKRNFRSSFILLFFFIINLKCYKDWSSRSNVQFY